MVFPIGELEIAGIRMRRDVIELANVKTHWQNTRKENLILWLRLTNYDIARLK